MVLVCYFYCIETRIILILILCKENQWPLLSLPNSCKRGAGYLRFIITFRVPGSERAWLYRSMELARSAAISALQYREAGHPNTCLTYLCSSCDTCTLSWRSYITNDSLPVPAPYPLPLSAEKNLVGQCQKSFL